MKKRLLSAALALAMVLTLLPVSAFADGGDLSAAPPANESTASNTDKGTNSTGDTETKTETETTPSASDATTPAPVKNGPLKAPTPRADAAPAVSGRTTAYYYDQADVDATPKKNGVTVPGWYYISGTDSAGTWYAPIPSGVVSAAATTTAKSGVFYSDLGAALTARVANIKLINSQSGSGLSLSASASIDLNGQSVTGNGTMSVPGAFTLTFSDSSYTSGAPTGTVALNINVGAAVSPQNGRVVLNNVALTGSVVEYFSSSPNAATATGATVVVNNSTVAGNIQLFGRSLTGAATSGGSVYVGGRYASVAQAVQITHTNAAGQRNGTNGKVLVTDNATVTGMITVEQTSGDGVVTVSAGGKANGGITVNQNSGGSTGAPTVSVTGSGSSCGRIEVTQTTGGVISAASSGSTGLVKFVSTKGTGTDPTVNVDTSATVNAIDARADSLKVNIGSNAHVTNNVSVYGRNANTLTGTQASTLIAPVVTLNGGTVGGIVKAGSAVEGLEKDYTVTIQGGSTVTGGITLPKAQISVTNSRTGDVNLGSGTLTVNGLAAAGNSGSRANTLGNVILGKYTAYTGAYGARAVLTVNGFGNTIGTISQNNTNSADPNPVKIAVTIPGALGANQNPNDNDDNRINAFDMNNMANWDTANSFIKGGHYAQALNSGARQLLPRDIAYQVMEVTTSAARNGNYKYSYWMDSAYLVNCLVEMRNSIDTARNAGIITKNALDANGGLAAGSKYVTLYMYDPRTVDNYNPVRPDALPSGTANKVLEIRFAAPTGNTIMEISMPSAVGSDKSITWYPLTTPTNTATINGNAVQINTSGTQIPGGQAITPVNDISYVSNDVSYKITKVLNVQVATTLQGVNPTVKAQLQNGNVVLSGLTEISGNGNAAVIPLVLETDAMEAVYVNAIWNPTTKALTFTDPTGNYPNGGGAIPSVSIQTGGALRISGTDNSKLVLTESKTEVGLQAGSLTLFDLSVTIQGNQNGALDGQSSGGHGGIVANTSRIPDAQVNGKDLKDALAAALTKPAGSTAGYVNFSLSPTVQQEFGAYIAKLNQNSLDTQLKKVQTDKYKEQNPNTAQTVLNNLSQAQLEGTGYTRVAVVLYMQMDITSFDRATYAMTATMTPYARVEVQDTIAPFDDPVVIVNGTSLGTLDSTNPGQVTVQLPDVSGVFVGLTAAPNFAHQNATYVAAVDNARTFVLQHTADNGAGFGTIVLNDTRYLAEVRQQDAPAVPPAATTWSSYNPAKYYDTLQAAVDDTRNGEKIFVNKVSGSITEFPIDVTGRARTFYIYVDGNQKVTRANSASGVVITQPSGTTTEYTVQLTRDNVVTPKPTQKPISIVAVAVTGGSASLSASRADEGDTITVTLSPAAGYRSNGITVRTDAGTTIAASGAGNQYTFAVPKGQEIKSITVTPAFVRTAVTGVTITVANPSVGGTAATSAGNAQVAVGTPVTVTTIPATGYRTMGLNVTSNAGTTTATRTGVNSFTFTVPTGATNVVVTPRFDINNGTVFEDVWSTEYFSSAVAWAVGRNVTDGTSTYLFSPYNNCTRAEMVTFLWRAAGRPAVTGVANPFWDVQAGSYYYDAVLWAVSKGITKGVENNRFGVNEYVTRGQAVTFLYRYEGSPAVTTGSRFQDVSAREYYATPVAWATAKGVTNGTSTTLFSPNQAVTRAQAVTFLYRDITGTRA